MASVKINERKRANGETFYQVQVRGKGVDKPYSKSFDEPERASSWAAEQERIHAPVIVPEVAVISNVITSGSAPQEAVTGFTIANTMDAYLDSIRIDKNGKKCRTVDTTLRSRLNVLSRHFGDQEIGTITEKDILTFRAARYQQKAHTRNNNVSGSTIRKQLEILKRLLNWSKKVNGTQISVEINKDLLPDEGKPRERIINEAEYERMLHWCSIRRKWLGLALVLAYELAMRRGEIFAIVPRWVDFDARCINLPSEVCKNGEARKVPLNTKATILLREIIGEGDKKKLPDQPIFNIRPNSVPSAFRVMRTELGIEHGECVFHSFRHTAATRYGMRDNIDLDDLARITGHKDLKMVRRYLHKDTAHIASLMD